MNCSTPPSLSITNSHSLLKLMSLQLVMPSNHVILCHPLLLLPLIFPSIRVFSSELALWIRWPRYWSFSFSICPYNEYSELISFWTSLVAQMVKRLSTVWETQVQSLGWDDPLEEGMALQYTPTPVFSPGESPWTEEPGGLQSLGSQSWTLLSNWAYQVAKVLEPQHQSFQWMFRVDFL